MARYTDAVCRLCRRTGQKLYLKGDRCFTPKCAVERRPVPPGHQPQQRRRRKISDRGQQLLEKQKVRRYYGVLEKQFRRTYHEAQRRPGVTGETLLALLEKRLDNVVHRLGFAQSRAQSRQLVRHGHVTVNGRKVDIPSMELRVGDRIGWTARGQRSTYFQMMKTWQGGREVPNWLLMDPVTLEGTVAGEPTRDQIDARFNESAIVEHYSR